MKFAVPALTSAVAGLTLGVAAVLAITLAAQQDSRPDHRHSADPGSSMLGNVEYGHR
ncbi:DUF2613 domain-containing protein [Nocardia inohanensis]|uniref:DUF2613 domain-containing protein n=1 Tax=Nocardia inohanensis TaxID=209246 RepID=UPI000A03A773|nr:DUF2613 domain-containing protein [Nocardia inohanensis]